MTVSSTRNAHRKKQRSSRLRETIIFFITCCLVHAKHSHLDAKSAMPCQATLIPQSRNTKIKIKAVMSAAKCNFISTPSKMSGDWVLLWCISSRRNDTFFDNHVFRPRETRTFSMPSPTQPALVNVLDQLVFFLFCVVGKSRCEVWAGRVWSSSLA